MNFDKLKSRNADNFIYEEEQEISLLDIFNACKKNIKLIICIVLVVLLISLLYCFCIMKNKYTSTATITTASQQLSNDITALIKSDKVLDAVSDKTDIKNLKNDYQIEASSNDKNRLVKVSVTGTDPENTAEVANCITEQTAKIAKETLKGDTSINVIQESYPVYAPSGPPRLKYMLIACILAFVGSIAFVAFKELKNSNKICGHNDIKKISDYPLLSQIPYYQQPKIK